MEWAGKSRKRSRSRLADRDPAWFPGRVQARPSPAHGQKNGDRPQELRDLYRSKDAAQRPLPKAYSNPRTANRLWISAHAYSPGSRARAQTSPGFAADCWELTV